MSYTTPYASGLVATTSMDTSAITPPDRRRRRSSCSPPPAPRAPSHRRDASMQQQHSSRRRHQRVPSLAEASPATRTLSAFTALCFAHEPSTATIDEIVTPPPTCTPSFQTPDLCSPTSSISNSSTAGTPEGGMRQLTLASSSEQMNMSLRGGGESEKKLAASPILGGGSTPKTPQRGMMGGWTSPLMQSALHRRQHSVPLDPRLLISAGPLGGLGIDEGMMMTVEEEPKSEGEGGLRSKKEEPFWSMRRSREVVVIDTA